MPFATAAEAEGGIRWRRFSHNLRGATTCKAAVLTALVISSSLTQSAGGDLRTAGLAGDVVRRGVALSALYASANGRHWNNSEGWMAGDPCTSSWYGVSCKTDRFGATLLRVVALHENRLEGTLPTQLGHLSFVSNLVLSSNHNDNATRGSLRGCLPTQLGSMTALSVAKAFGERLSGQIPTQLGRWTALTIAAL